MPIRCVQRRFPCFIALAAILTVAPVGCALTGSTTRETLDIRPGAPERVAVPIVVEKVVVSADAPGLIAAGSMRVGAFSLDDLANIRGSLGDTLRRAAGAAPAGIEDRLRLSVVIRRYLVAHSNNAAGVLAAVDWCAARGDGSAIYREIFYASGEGQWVTSLGEVKNRAQRVLVQRISESALRLARVGGGAPDLPVRVVGTYDDVNAAAATLPATLKSIAVGGPGLVFLAIATVENLATPRTAIPWGEARTEGSISCQQLQAPDATARGVSPALATPATPEPVPAASPGAPVIPRAEVVPAASSQTGAGGADIYCRASLGYAGGCGSDPNAE